MYVIPEDVDLRDALAFAYGVSLKRNVDEKRELLLGNRDPGYFFEDGQDDDGKESNKSCDPEEEDDDVDSMIGGSADVSRDTEIPQD